MFADLILGLAHLGLKPTSYRPRPSLAGPERCLRQLVYKGRGTPEPPVGRRLAMVFEDGHQHEETTLTFLKHSLFVLVAEQLPITIHNAFPWRSQYPDYRCPECSKAQGQDIRIPATDLHGHLDGLLKGLLGTIYLLEHKAVVSHYFRRYWEEEQTPLDYFTQIVMYLRGLNEEGCPVTQGALVIKNKDTGAILEYEFHYDYAEDLLTVTAIIKAPGHEYKKVQHLHHRLYFNAIDRFETVDRHVTEQTLPARLDDMDDIRCQYCPHADHCWENIQPAALTEHISIPETLRSDAEEFITLDQQLTPLEHRHKELKDKIKPALIAMDVAEATVGQHLLVLSKCTSTRLDESRLPIALKKHFSRSQESIKLMIKAATPRSSASSKPKRAKSQVAEIPAA
jgi:hypothetical protein